LFKIGVWEERKMGVCDEAGARSGEPGLGERETPLYRVIVPKQNLVVRLNGLRPDDPEDGYLPAVRSYGVMRTAWAIWREVPGTEPGEALRLARRVRCDSEAEVLVATRSLAEHVRGMLRARHRLVARLERAA